jgi:hypothetical protein
MTSVTIRPESKSKNSINYPNLDVNSIGEIISIDDPQRMGTVKWVMVKFGDVVLPYLPFYNFELITD